MPDLMADMLEQKIAQPRAGATTAWVPSPTAATLHALHYHQVDVSRCRRSSQGKTPHHASTSCWPSRWPTRAGVGARGDPRGGRQQLPVDPRLRGALDRPGRGLLQGARHPRRRADGRPCDAAHLQPAPGQLAAPRRRHRGGGARPACSGMAAVVDRQNAGDPDYRPMAPDFDASIAFKAAATWSCPGRRSPAATPSRSCTGAAGSSKPTSATTGSRGSCSHG